jgi:hypothetical protein
LFILEGTPAETKVDSAQISAACASREGHIFFNSAGAGEVYAPSLNFINKQQGYNTKVDLMSIQIHNINNSLAGAPASVGLSQAVNLLHGVYGQVRIKKIGDKKFVTDFFGISPADRVLKVILRETQMDKTFKRIVFFVLGIPPEEGGRTWVASPVGFPWVMAEDAWIHGESTDIQALRERLSVFSKGKDLFPYLMVTNAIAIFLGREHPPAGENVPKFLRFSPSVSDDVFWSTTSDAIQNTIKESCSSLPVKESPLLNGFSYLEKLLEKTDGTIEVRVSTCFGLTEQLVSIDADSIEEMF